MAEITLRIPSKYASAPSISSTRSAPSPPAAPPLSWLLRTWTVTDSTLSMWRNARNVRITYSSLPPSSSGATRIDDLVEYEALNGKGSVKSVAGVDTAASGAPAKDKGKGKGKAESETEGQQQEQEQEHEQEPRLAEWDWRGKSWLFFVSSHWEVLAWGEVKEGDAVKERWIVTWFAPTVFTKEGVDFYSDRTEGLSEETRGRLMEAFGRLDGGPAAKVAEMVRRDMRGVKVELPWLGR